MKDNSINHLNSAAGTDLFSSFGSFLNYLSEHDEAVIAGGDNSRSKSGRRPRRRRRRRRGGRRRGSRSRT